MPFAEEFINAYIAGQQAKESKFDLQRKQKKALFEDEDRDIEKEMLTHRLKEMKIQQRMQARQAAEQNFNLLSGTPENELTPDQTEGGVLPAHSAIDMGGDQPSIQTLMKQIDFPGIEELGIPGVQRRPPTEESQLARTLAEARIKMGTTLHSVGPGGLATGTGQVIVPGRPPTPPRPIGLTSRGKDGTETTEYVNPQDALGRVTTKARLPQRASTTVVMPSEDMAATFEAVKAGRFGPDQIRQLPVKDRGKLLGLLAKDKFDLNRVAQDAKAIATHFNALNGEAQNSIRIAGEVVKQDLAELEDIQAAWKAGGYGAFSRLALAAAKNNRLSPESQKNAQDFEATITRLQESLAVLRASGSNPSNKLLDAAAAELNTGSNIGQAIARIKREVEHRVAAIGSLEAITPSSQAGGASHNYDPATDSFIPVGK